MSVDDVEGVRIIERGSEFMSVDDAERVQIVEEGIFAMNVVGDAKRVRFVVEGDLGSGETDYENATPVNGGTRAVRRMSAREKAIDASLKPKRKCGECGEKTNTHTKKTCPLGPKATADAKAMNNTGAN
ncbi:hypothetical protein CTI12_AA273340 [Artemisia annua]|uniref:Uncharacterized protein n=1 Tax=Artemisia annua TaxID=35608 RepID=A0A2U1NF90_ARTAN|nr:hypothetical protein CTI12_AA273340 [Artemisia annua]